MKLPHCLDCDLNGKPRTVLRRYGSYYRTSDSKTVRRGRCPVCKKTYSLATFDTYRGLKKRQKNGLVKELLCSGVSQRRAARIAKINRKTVARILNLEALRDEFLLRRENLSGPKAKVVQFDDLETFEHTKCKPISVTLAVEEGTRRILGVEVSSMASNGKLAQKSRKLYGRRRDESRSGRARLLKRLKDVVEEDAVFKSDQNPYYPRDIRKHFPKAFHVTYKGKRGSLGGQGELKKVKFDPLFSLNHTCAMLRANICRLIRRTWCTTKKVACLYKHLILYAAYHNLELAKKAAARGRKPVR